MITSSQAKKRAQESKEFVARFAEVLGKEIEQASDRGEFEFKYTGGKMYDPVKIDEIIAKGNFANPKVPEFWKLVKAYMEAAPLHFRVRIDKTAPYVPRGGLGIHDDDDNEPQVSLFMLISWA